MSEEGSAEDYYRPIYYEVNDHLSVL